MKFRFIHQERRWFGVDALCAAMAVSRGGYWAWLKRRPSARQLGDSVLLADIHKAHKKGRGVYGSPRIHEALGKAGVECGKKRVERLMKENGIRAKQGKKYKPVGTDSSHHMPVAPNNLNRQFERQAPNEAWVAWVRRHLALLKLDGKVIATMRKNGLSFTQAEHVARVLKSGSMEDALEAAKAMASGQLSRRSAEGALRKMETPHKRSLNACGEHYRASLAMMAGANPAAVQKILRHSDPRITSAHHDRNLWSSCAGIFAERDRQIAVHAAENGKSHYPFTTGHREQQNNSDHGLKNSQRNRRR